MTSSAGRLRTGLRHLMLAASCGATAAITLALAFQTFTRISGYWDQLIAGRPVHISVITSGITLVLLLLGGGIAARWTLAFTVIFLAAATKSGTALNLRLAKAALRLAPRIARTTLVTAAGASMVLTAGPALAAQGDIGPQGAPDHNSSAIYLGFDSAPDPSVMSPPVTSAPTPTAPAPPAPPAPTAPSTPPSGSDQKTTAATTSNNVVVAAGDSLWSITAQLNPTATNAELNVLWPQLYESNKQVIGPNPHLIIPGTQLFIPASLSR